MKKIRELQIGDTIYEVNPLEQLSVDLNSDEIIINGDNNNGDSIMSVTIPQATAQKAGVVGTDLFNLIHKNANQIENIPDQIQDVVAITNTETETCNFLKRDVVINSYGKNIQQIGGNIVKNLVDGTFVSGWNRNDFNLSLHDSIVVVKTKADSYPYITLDNLNKSLNVVNHIIYSSAYVKSNVDTVKLSISGQALANLGLEFTAAAHDWTVLSVRGTITQSVIDKERNYTSVRAANSSGTVTTDDYLLVKNYIVIDLTEMFGAGNEPTKEECDRMFGTMDALPQGLTIAQPTGLKSTGYNQWNPENVLINKTITDNAIVDGDKNIAVIECLPCKVGAGENNGYIIGYGEGDSWSDDGIEIYFTPLNPMEIEGELYMHKLEQDATYGTYVPQCKGYLLVVTPTTDKLCIKFHWSGDREFTDYEEYVESNVAIPVIPEMSEWGLAGISAGGTLAADTIDLDRMVYIKKIGCFNGGSIGWKYDETYGGFYGLSYNLSKKPRNGSPFILNEYSYVGSYAKVTDKTIAFIYNIRPFIKDSSYTDVDSFAESIKDVKFYYELAEPEEYPIVIQSSITYISGNSEGIIGSKIPVNVILNLGDKRSLVTETTKFLDQLYENTNTNNAKETADVITNALQQAIQTLEISPNEDDVELDLINTQGTYNHVVLPAATIEKAGVMSVAQFQNLATLMIQMQDLIARVKALENPGVMAEVSSNVLTFTNGAEVETNNLALTGNNIDITDNNLNIK